MGRTAAAKSFDKEAINLAVIAHIRHAQTDYDTFLAEGVDRYEARQRVKDDIEEILTTW